MPQTSQSFPQIRTSPHGPPDPRPARGHAGLPPPARTPESVQAAGGAPGARLLCSGPDVAYGPGVATSGARGLRGSSGQTRRGQVCGGGKETGARGRRESAQAGRRGGEGDAAPTLPHAAPGARRRAGTSGAPAGAARGQPRPRADSCQALRRGAPSRPRARCGLTPPAPRPRPRPAVAPSAGPGGARRGGPGRPAPAGGPVTWGVAGGWAAFRAGGGRQDEEEEGGRSGRGAGAAGRGPGRQRAGRAAAGAPAAVAVAAATAPAAPSGSSSGWPKMAALPAQRFLSPSRWVGPQKKGGGGCARSWRSPEEGGGARPVATPLPQSSPLDSSRRRRARPSGPRARRGGGKRSRASAVSCPPRPGELLRRFAWDLRYPWVLQV